MRLARSLARLTGRLLLLGLALWPLPGRAADQAPSPAPLAAAPDQALQVRVQLKARQSATLSAQSAGMIEAIPIRDGESFKAGQVLAKLHCAVVESQLVRAQAGYEKKAKVSEIFQSLFRLKSKSALEVDVAKAEAAEAAAEVRVARAMLDRCTLRAPFAGKAGEVTARAGQWVGEGQAILEIFDDRELEIECIVPSRWLAWLAPGLRFQVRIDETGKTYEAEVLRLSGRVDPVSQSIKIYGRIRGDGGAPDPDAESGKGGLRVGMSGLALIEPPQ